MPEDEFSFGELRFKRHLQETLKQAQVTFSLVRLVTGRLSEDINPSFRSAPSCNGACHALVCTAMCRIAALGRASAATKPIHYAESGFQAVPFKGCSWDYIFLTGLRRQVQLPSMAIPRQAISWRKCTLWFWVVDICNMTSARSRLQHACKQKEKALLHLYVWGFGAIHNCGHCSLVFHHPLLTST